MVSWIEKLQYSLEAETKTQQCKKEYRRATINPRTQKESTLKHWEVEWKSKGKLLIFVLIYVHDKLYRVKNLLVTKKPNYLYTLISLLTKYTPNIKCEEFHVSLLSWEIKQVTWRKQLLYITPITLNHPKTSIHAFSKKGQ